MSKVKMIDGMNKTKARRALRRKETFNKKNDLKKNLHIKNAYIKDHVDLYKKIKIVVPEQVIERGDLYYDEKGNMRFGKVKKTIPACEYNTSTYIGEQKIKPYVKRYYNSWKTYHKKQSNRRVRRLPINEDVYSNKSYKKIYDIFWYYD